MFLTFHMNFNVINTTMSTQKIYITNSAVKFKFRVINRLRTFSNKGLLFMITSYFVLCLIFLLLMPSWWIYQINVNYSSEIKKNISCYFACVETDYFCVSKLIIYQLLLFCQVNDRMTTQKKHFLYLLFSVNYLHSHGKIKFLWECRYIWTKIS